MGVVIFTNDDEKFMVGNYILMTGKIDTPPSNPDTTYILRTDRFTQKDVEAWLPYVGNRLVVCTEKPPVITGDLQDSVIIDEWATRQGRSYLNDVMAMLSWKDRKRVWYAIRELPIPYGLAFLRQNRDDIALWRRIAQANMELPDEYVRAIFAYGVEASHEKTKWPKKNKDVQDVPLPFRQTDKYWKEILEGNDSAANEIRDKAVEIPKNINKTKVGANEWI